MKAEMRGKGRQLGGFTMTELLVTISLIVILGSLLLPAWDKAKSRATDTECMANLRMWGGALTTYIADNGGIYRNWFSGTRNHADAAQYWPWYMLYASDYTAAQLQQGRCPLGAGRGSTVPGVHYGFYAADPNGKRVKNAGGEHYELRVATHPSPSKAILLADSITSAGEQTHTIFAEAYLSRGGIHTRHGGKANLCFLDGHIETATPERLGELGVTKYYNEDGAVKSTPVVN